MLVVTRASSLFLGGPSCYQKDQKSFGGVRGGHKESRRTYGALSTFRVERERDGKRKYKIRNGVRSGRPSACAGRCSWEGSLAIRRIRRATVGCGGVARLAAVLIGH